MSTLACIVLNIDQSSDPNINSNHEDSQLIIQSLIQNLNELEQQIIQKQAEYEQTHQMDDKCKNYYNYWLLKHP